MDAAEDAEASPAGDVQAAETLEPVVSQVQGESQDAQLPPAYAEEAETQAAETPGHQLREAAETPGNQLGDEAAETPAGHQLGETAETPGHQQSEAAETSGHQLGETAETPGHQQSEAAETPGHQLGEAAETPGHQQSEAAETPGHQQSEAAETLGHQCGHDTQQASTTGHGEQTAEVQEAARRVNIILQLGYKKLLRLYGLGLWEWRP